MTFLRLPAYAFLLLLAAATPLAAQGVPYTPTGGVELDAEGVLRSHRRVDSRLTELRKRAGLGCGEETLVYLSLPRLFAEARECAKSGTPLPDSIRFLEGMTKLRYIFVFPDQKDLVIAGPAETFDVDSTYRPLGKRTGRPVLQFDDLVTALRACGPGRNVGMLGCDLVMTPEIADRIRKATKEIEPKIPEIGAAKASEEIARAAGPQPVNYYGVGTDTRFAMVCIEADYQLKELMLGLLESPTPRVQSYVSLAGKAEPPRRACFESKYDAIACSPEGDAYELRGPSLQVISTLFSVEKHDVKEGEISAAAKKFTEQCNRNIEELCREIISFADLQNLSDLAVLAALIGRDRLDRKVDWDLSWAMNDYKPTLYRAPASAQTACAYRAYGKQTIFSSGGVALTPASCLDSRVRDEKGVLRSLSLRPPDGEWSSLRKE